MNVLIIKLGATGDVVRTTTLLNRFRSGITWITADKNAVLLQGLQKDLRCFTWEQREQARDRAYDLVINLEDTEDIGLYLRTVETKRVFGAYLKKDGQLAYSDDSRGWFDLSLISVHGREEADRLKLKNRRTYQDLIFEGLGMKFEGEPYLLPAAPTTGLAGDVAISPVAGPVWPMKAWDHYGRLQQELESQGLKVNVLPTRASLLEHLGDVQAHRCLVSGDSLPMHLALGTETRCVSIFNCTSPWEIHDYGIQTKLVSPLLSQFFYKRGQDPRATAAIQLEEVLNAVKDQLKAKPAPVR